MAGFSTRLVHQPRQNDNQTGAVAVPVYKATTFAYPKIGAQVKYDYSRSGNPTRNAVEEQLACLEGGRPGLCFCQRNGGDSRGFGNFCSWGPYRHR